MIFLKTFVFLVMVGFSSQILASFQSNQEAAWSACASDGHNGTYTCQRSDQSGQFRVCSINASGGAWDCHNFPQGVDCPISGQVLNPVTHICAAPVVCTSGTSAALTQFSAKGELVISIGGGPKLTSGGCEYQCSGDIIHGSYNDAGTYSNYNCTGTGKTTAQSTGSTAASDVDAYGQPNKIPAATSGCVKGLNSAGLIVESCVKPDGCGTFNGVNVCMDGINIKSGDTVLNNGAGKNCVQGGGKIVCASDVANATSTVKMLQPDGSVKTAYFNDKLQKFEIQTVVTNPNGSVTTTINETNNLVGSTGVGTSSTQNTDGSKTTTKTGQSQADIDSSKLDAVATNTGATAVNTNNTATNTKTLSDDFKAFKGVESDFGQGSNSGDFNSVQANEQSSILSQITGSTNDFSGLTFSTPAEWVSSMLPSSTNCAGSINQTVFGKQFIFAPCEKLQPLRDVLAWVFALLAILDILKITFRGNF